jgi:integrase
MNQAHSKRSPHGVKATPSSLGITLIRFSRDRPRLHISPPKVVRSAASRSRWLRIEHPEQREEHWAIVDLKGKAGHVRTVPVPGRVMEELRVWLNAAGIDRGKIFRRVTKMGRVLGESMTEKAVWHIVKDSAKRIGLEKLVPHDVRRTCARLCHAAGGELEQIQFLLGHVSVQTTERYLGCKQRIRSAVNDQIGIEPRP